MALIERAAGLRRGAVQALQLTHQAAEARGAARESQSMLLERFARHRIGRALAEHFPGLIERLRRQAATLARVGQIATWLAARRPAIAQRKTMQGRGEAEYWRRAQSVRGLAAVAGEQAETQKLTNKRGRGR